MRPHYDIYIASVCMVYPETRVLLIRVLNFVSRRESSHGLAEEHDDLRQWWEKGNEELGGVTEEEEEIQKHSLYHVRECKHILYCALCPAGCQCVCMKITLTLTLRLTPILLFPSNSPVAHPVVIEDAFLLTLVAKGVIWSTFLSVWTNQKAFPPRPFYPRWLWSFPRWPRLLLNLSKCTR